MTSQVFFSHKKSTSKQRNPQQRVALFRFGIAAFGATYNPAHRKFIIAPCKENARRAKQRKK